MLSAEKSVVHRWFDEVWNEGQEGAIDRLFAADGVAHGLEDAQGRPLIGPAAYGSFMQAYKGAFPDLRFEVADAVQEGELVAFRCTVTGTHTGTGLGIAPTDRPISIEGMGFARVRGGQIVEAWNVFDFRSLMGQLGGGMIDDAPYNRV